MNPLRGWWLLCGLVIGSALSTSTSIAAEPKAEVTQERIVNKPKTPGQFVLHQRTRTETAKGSGEWKEGGKEVVWNASETAIIVCDMWDGHYCVSASERVADMVPRMNAVLTAARNHGATVIHAPSGVTYHYADMPQRKRMQQATKYKPELPLEAWCHVDPKREPELPVDVSKQACDDAVVGAVVQKFSRQHTGLTISGWDGVSDNGEEIYSYLKQEGLKNIVLMGVHTNMCVLGRPFGIRQMVKQGFNVVLARDLTDAMYDPREKPYVSHTRGTELIVEHIEKYWSPSIVGDDLMRVARGSADPK
ncbi:MAG: isochorismatase family protein [Planctomycetaceae bacterium]|nr:isochorismatase family protein [Planctomycetaceae bacterium]